MNVTRTGRRQFYKPMQRTTTNPIERYLEIKKISATANPRNLLEKRVR
jgi:hypothetical protein